MSWISFILCSTVAESVGSQRASTASLTCWMVAASVSGSGREPSRPSDGGEHLALLGSAAPPGWVALLEEVYCSPCVVSPRALLLLAKPRHLSPVGVGGWGCFQDAIGSLSCALLRGGGMWAQLWQLSVCATGSCGLERGGGARQLVLNNYSSTHIISSKLEGVARHWNCFLGNETPSLHPSSGSSAHFCKGREGLPLFS